MKYRAVLHNPNNDMERIESIWLDDKGIAEATGRVGLNLYGGSHFTIEERDDENEH